MKKMGVILLAVAAACLLLFGVFAICSGTAYGADSARFAGFATYASAGLIGCVISLVAGLGLIGLEDSLTNVFLTLGGPFDLNARQATRSAKPLESSELEEEEPEEEVPVEDDPLSRGRPMARQKPAQGLLKNVRLDSIRPKAKAKVSELKSASASLFEDESEPSDKPSKKDASDSPAKSAKAQKESSPTGFKPVSLFANYFNNSEDSDDSEDSAV